MCDIFVSRLALSVAVDLTYAGSPVLPVLPIAHFARGLKNGGFFYSAAAPMENQLSYSFGVPIDYRSAQAGTPQTLTISESTGHVTWDTTHIASGDYSTMLAVRDTRTGLRAVAETVLKVSSDSVGNSSVPRFVTSSVGVLPNDIIYVMRGTSIIHELTLEDEGGVEDLSLMALSPLPVGMSISLVEQTPVQGNVYTFIFIKII